MAVSGTSGSFTSFTSSLLFAVSFVASIYNQVFRHTRLLPFSISAFVSACQYIRLVTPVRDSLVAFGLRLQILRGDFPGSRQLSSWFGSPISFLLAFLLSLTYLDIGIRIVTDIHFSLTWIHELWQIFPSQFSLIWIRLHLVLIRHQLLVDQSFSEVYL